jgi:hypothetical protein
VEKRGINAKKKREPNWFSHVIWSSQGFHPQFWICLTCGSYSSLNQSLVRIKLLQILWTDDTQFH